MACLLVTGSARSDRYRVQVAGQVTYVTDGGDWAAQGAPVPGLVAPGTDPLGKPLAEATPPVDLPPPTPRPLGSPETIEPPGASALEGDLDQALDPPSPPMTASFRERMAGIYATTDDEHLIPIWSLVQDEDPGLTEGERVGNAVIRYIVGNRVALPGAQVDGPGLARGARGSLVTNSGLQLRSVPWGSSIGSLAAGNTITLTGASDGAWWEVDSPQGRGWVSGPYLRIQ